MNDERARMNWRKTSIQEEDNHSLLVQVDVLVQSVRFERKLSDFNIIRGAGNLYAKTIMLRCFGSYVV